MVQLWKIPASPLSHWLSTVNPSHDDEQYSLTCSVMAEQGSLGNHSEKYKYYSEMHPLIKLEYGGKGHSWHQ